MSKTISERASATGERSPKLIDLTIGAVRVLVSGQVSRFDVKPKAGSQEMRVALRQPAIMIGLRERELNYSVGSMGPAGDEGKLRENVLKEGLYALSNKCIRLNDYSEPSIRLWADDYVFVRPLTDDERLKFRATQTDASELMGAV